MKNEENGSRPASVLPFVILHSHSAF